LAKNCKNKCVKKASIGGQALIEGIMMRGPKMTAMAVRDPDGRIILEKWKTDASPKSKLAKLPIVRGVYGFISSMVSGYKCLMRSAEISGLEEAEEELRREKEAKKAKKRAREQGEDGVSSAEATASLGNTEKPEAAEAVETAVPNDGNITEEPAQDTVAAEAVDKENTENTENSAKRSKDKKEKRSSPLVTGVMLVASVLGVALSVGLFIFLPILIYDWCSPLLPQAITGNDILNSLVSSVFEGVLKIIILVAYMLLVSLMKDIRRTFQYHGAEHKTIFCYEHGKELTVENVRRERRFHPRCGTSFLILMLIVGIFVSFFIDPAFLLITKSPELLKQGAYPFIRFAVKLLLTPLIMGLGYELIKFAGRHDNIITRIISAPGVWLQHITVLEPDDGMIECAIRAFVEVLPDEEKPKTDESAAVSEASDASESTESVSDTSEVSENTEPEPQNSDTDTSEKN